MNECLEFKSSAVISFLTRTRSVCAQLIWGEAGARLFYINPTNLLFEKINRRRIGGARSRDHRCAGVSTTAGRRSREEDRAREAALPATLRIKFLQHGRQEESDEVNANRKKLPQPWLQETRDRLKAWNRPLGSARLNEKDATEWPPWRTGCFYFFYKVSFR